MLYKIARFLASLVARIFRVEYTGTENIPESGGLIIASNHSSYLDSIILAPVCKRPIHFMAKKELFKIPIFNSVIRLLKAFPVDREKPGKSSILNSKKILKSGNILGMFPEGTRHVEYIGKPFLGIGFLSVKNNVPILPVAIYGTAKAAPKGKYLPRFTKIKVKVGNMIKPVKVYDKKSEKNLIKDITYQTMNQLEDMLKDLGEEGE